MDRKGRREREMQRQRQRQRENRRRKEKGSMQESERKMQETITNAGSNEKMENHCPVLAI